MLTVFGSRNEPIRMLMFPQHGHRLLIATYALTATADAALAWGFKQSQSGEMYYGSPGCDLHEDKLDRMILWKFEDLHCSNHNLSDATSVRG